ncbi:Cupredoxin [Mycena capillaripes]|nr:Cupredoxin [Mycena capillaripes]
MRLSLALAAVIPILSVYADNILIMVGADNQPTFTPANVTAKVGDTIAFQFMSKNHSVTQSTFSAPCTKQGLDSAFQFILPSATVVPEFSFNLTDSAPLWFFCAQTNPVSHCNMGMVFSVNADPTSAKSHAAFQALAMGSGASPASGVPGDAASTTGGAVGATQSGPTHPPNAGFRAGPSTAAALLLLTSLVLAGEILL